MSAAGVAPRAALLLVGVAVLTACASRRFPSFRSEDGVPDLAALKAAAAREPSTTTLVPTAPDGAAPLRVAIHRWGRATSPRLVVLVHGVLSDSGTWRFVRGDLVRDHDLLAVDLPGCGQSDAPDPRLLGPGGYGPSALAARVLEAIRGASPRGRDARPVTLVGHSLGGAVVLRMLSDPRLRARNEDVLGRVDRVVLLAPLDVVVEKASGEVRDFLGLTPFEVSVGTGLGIVSRRTAEGVRDSVDDPTCALREEAYRWMAVLADPGRFRAAQAMLRDAVPQRGDLRPDWPGMESLEARYAAVDRPCLVCWGARDEVLPVAVGYKLALQLPRARLVVLRSTKHALSVERPRSLARWIRAFEETGGQGWPLVQVVDPEEVGPRPSASVRALPPRGPQRSPADG